MWTSKYKDRNLLTCYSGNICNSSDLKNYESHPMLLSSLRFCSKCALLWPVQQWRPLSRHLQCCVLQKLSAAWRLMPSSICLILCQWFWSRCKLQIQFSKWWLFNLCTFSGRTRKCYRCLGRLPVKLLLCRQCHASRSFLKNLLMLF